MTNLFKNINEVHFELTDKCNMQCTYCYAEVNDTKSKLIHFKLEYIEKLITEISMNSKFNEITVTFHGGEPLLMGIEWYKKALNSIQDILLKYNKKPSFSLQSNLLLLDIPYIELFSKYNVKIGTSIDGPKDIHNKLRSDYDKTIKYIDLLKKNDIFGGVITVVSIHNWDKIVEIYENFLTLCIDAFHINIVSSVGHGKDNKTLTTDQILKSYIDSYESMIKYNFKIIDTRTLQKIRRFYFQPSNQELSTNLQCDNPICHAGIYMLNINFKGEIYPCGTAGTSGNDAKFQLTNIQDINNYTNEQYENSISNFHQKNSKYYNECQYCKAKFICEHGCPAFDINDNITEYNRCEATKLFYDYLSMKSNNEEIINKIKYKLGKL